MTPPHSHHASACRCGPRTPASADAPHSVVRVKGSAGPVKGELEVTVRAARVAGIDRYRHPGPGHRRRTGRRRRRRSGLAGRLPRRGDRARRVRRLRCDLRHGSVHHLLEARPEAGRKPQGFRGPGASQWVTTAGWPGMVRTRILASRFPSWQWVLVALALPVATCAAGHPPGGAEERRHLFASMDTLVSMGITAACSWSVYAMFFLDRDTSGTSAWIRSCGSGGGIYLEVVPSVTTFQLAGRLLRTGSGSWSGPVSGSPPTALCLPCSPRSTGP